MSKLRSAVPITIIVLKSFQNEAQKYKQTLNSLTKIIEKSKKIRKSLLFNPLLLSRCK